MEKDDSFVTAVPTTQTTPEYGEKDAAQHPSFAEVEHEVGLDLYRQADDVEYTTQDAKRVCVHSATFNVNGLIHL